MAITDIKNSIAEIRNEWQRNNNTALRVGTAMDDIVNFFFQYLTGNSVPIDLNHLYSPKAAFADFTALETEYPTGAEGIYVTSDDGHWWWWDGLLLEWKDGGLYQAALDIANELGPSETKVVNQRVVTEEFEKKLSIETQVLSASQKAITRENIDTFEDADIEGEDFAICDDLGRKILSIKNGKMDVNSSTIVETIDNPDFAICDENGFAIAWCKDGVWQFSNLTVAVNPYQISKNYGKSCGVFSGSVGSITNSEFAKQLWRDYLNLDITTYGEGGGGMSIKSFNTDWAGEVYTPRNSSMPMQVWKHKLAVDAQTDTPKDIYVIWNSTNDFWNQVAQPTIGLTVPVEIGSVNDIITTDVSSYNEDTLTKAVLDENFDISELTVCAGLQFMIKNLLLLNPLAEIYVFTPMRSFATRAAYDATFTDATYQHNLKEYVTAMKSVCEKYGVAILDQYNLWGITEYNYTEFFGNVLSTPDYTHPLQNGYEKVGWLQLEFLKNGK